MPRLPACALWLLWSTVACGGGAANDDGGGGAANDDGAPPGAEQTDPSCTTQPLPFYADDAVYSPTLERIVALAGYSVFLLDPTTLQSVEIRLPGLSVSLSLAPDGTTAAVAQYDSVSIVDLQRQSVTATISTMTTEGGNVVMAGNGFAYLFPRRYGEGDIDSVEIAAAKAHGPAGTFDGIEFAKLHPDGKSIYGMIGVSPGRLGVADISGGIGTGFREQLEHGDHVKGGNLWISPDGTDIFTGCGTAFRAAPGTADDMTYRAALPMVCTDEDKPLFPSIALDQTHDRVYAIINKPAGFNGSVRDEGVFGTYSYRDLATVDIKAVPCVAKGATTQPPLAQLVLTNSDASKIFVLARTETQRGVVSALATFDP
jgi:hypothetical protein